MQKFSQTISDLPWFGKTKPIMFLDLCQNKTHRILEWFNRLNMAKVECIALSLPSSSTWPLCLLDPPPQATAVAPAWLNSLSALSWASSPTDYVRIWTPLLSRTTMFHSISGTKQPLFQYINQNYKSIHVSNMHDRKPALPSMQHVSNCFCRSSKPQWHLVRFRRRTLINISE